MLIRLALAWMLGIVAAEQARLPAGWLWAGAGAGLLAALALGGPRRRRARLAALMLLCAALGGLRYLGTLPIPGPQSVTSLLERGEVTLTGNVTSEPRRSEEQQRVTLRVETATVNGRTGAYEGLVLVVLPPYPAYAYGDRLMVRGTLRRPRTAERPGEFDYRAYLAHRGIFVILTGPEEARRLPGRHGLAPLAAVLAFRAHCQAVLLRVLPEPQAALAIGVVLGIQSSIPDEVYQTFSITGTSHILVVSGWNFTIVAGMLGALATRLRLGRGATLALALVVMWIYAIFTGASAAVLRAAAMASLAAVARATDRSSEPWHLLLGACWLITLADPHTLWDVGFQLSALATASLFAYGAPVAAWFNQRRPFNWPALAPVTEALVATFAAQMLTLPLILYTFGNLSLVAPLANVLIVPVVPFAMGLGAMALLGGLVWLPLGQWLALAAWLPLTWIAEGARLLAAPRWASMQTPPFPLWILVGWYALIVLHWWSMQRVAPSETFPCEN
ncbi:MAG: ComEC/Rec2 family competence protein [Chloroflexaceae bacterium]